MSFVFTVRCPTQLHKKGCLLIAAGIVVLLFFDLFFEAVKSVQYFYDKNVVSPLTVPTIVEDTTHVLVLLEVFGRIVHSVLRVSAWRSNYSSTRVRVYTCTILTCTILANIQYRYWYRYPVSMHGHFQYFFS